MIGKERIVGRVEERGEGKGGSNMAPSSPRLLSPRSPLLHTHMDGLLLSCSHFL